MDRPISKHEGDLETILETEQIHEIHISQNYSRKSYIFISTVEWILQDSISAVSR